MNTTIANFDENAERCFADAFTIASVPTRTAFWLSCQRAAAFLTLAVALGAPAQAWLSYYTPTTSRAAKAR